MRLGHVLQSTHEANIELDHYRSDELKRAARFWVGKEAGSYNKEKCIAALTRVMNSNEAARRVPAALSEKERQVLAIFTRYGPTVSGDVLTAEMYARRLVQMPPKDNASPDYYRAYHDWKKNDLIRGLGEKLVLVGKSYDSYYSSSHTHRYPQSTLHPALVKAVAPAPPLAWNASIVCSEAVGTGRRPAAEVALDLWRVAAALRAMGTWPTVKGDSPAKATCARMQKEVGLRDAEKDPHVTTRCGVVVLRTAAQHGLNGFWGQGAMDPWGSTGTAPATASRRTGMALGARLAPYAAMAGWDWCRSRPRQRLHLRSHRPSELYHARELLVWALCGVAHAPGRWLDLETFLRDLWRNAGGFNRLLRR